MVEQCDGMSMHASSGTGLLVFTEDRSSRIHSEVYRSTLSAQIQSNAAIYFIRIWLDGAS